MNEWILDCSEGLYWVFPRFWTLTTSCGTKPGWGARRTTWSTSLQTASVSYGGKKFRIIIFATKTAPERLSRPELVIQLLTSLTSLRSLKDFSLNYMHSMYSNSFSIPLRNHLRKNEYCQWISDAQTSTTLEFELESAFSPPFPKWLYFLVMGLLPMILLSILNWLIYRAISKARWVLIEK